MEQEDRRPTTALALLEWLDGGSLLRATQYDGIDCDAVLDALDGDALHEQSWLRAKSVVDHAWDREPVDSEVVRIVDAVRERSFRLVSDATGQHEIASYVSDDMGLLARALVVGVDDPFLHQLWQSYIRRGLPR